MVAEERDHPSNGVKPGGDEAHIRRAALDQDTRALGNLTALLSKDESRRAMSYYRPQDRDRIIAGRGILRRIRAWIKDAKGSGLDCFDKFLATLEAWMEEITNYFVSRLSGGWVEGLNNKIKVLKRRGYGIRNLPNLFRRIWLDLKGYEAFAR
jgi:transposase